MAAMVISPEMYPGHEPQRMDQAVVGSTCASSVERFSPLERERVRAQRGPAVHGHCKSTYNRGWIAAVRAFETRPCIASCKASA